MRVAFRMLAGAVLRPVPERDPAVPARARLVLEPVRDGAPLGALPVDGQDLPAARVEAVVGGRGLAVDAAPERLVALARLGPVMVSGCRRHPPDKAAPG